MSREVFELLMAAMSKAFSLNSLLVALGVGCDVMLSLILLESGCMKSANIFRNAR